MKTLKKIKLTQLKSRHQSMKNPKDVSSQLFSIEMLFLRLSWQPCLRSWWLIRNRGSRDFLLVIGVEFAKFESWEKLPIEFADVLSCAGEALSHGMAVCLPHLGLCNWLQDLSHIFIPLPTQPTLFNLAASSESDKILLIKFFSRAFFSFSYLER